MTIAAWLIDAEKRLTRVLKDKELALQDTHWIAAKALKKDRSWLIAHSDTELKTLERWKLDRLLRRRLREEPLAYLLNSAPFYGRDFYVDKRVLIPRPETEDLIEIALRKLERVHQPTILDIGTGSGAIAITMALQHPNAHILASDASGRALAVAKKNAKHHGAKVHFSKGRLLHPKLVRQINYDSPLFILANLPYLPVSDKTTMPKSVTAFEPSKALFAPEQGMALNSGLLAEACALCPKLVLLEFDPPQAKELCEFARCLFPDATIRIHQDRCGRDRFLEVSID